MPKNILKYLVWLPFVVVGITLNSVLLTGCRSIPVPVEHTVIKKDSVILREKLVPFSVQETTIEKSFSHDQVDSIIVALKQMPVNSRTIYYTDPKFKTQLTFFLDSIGNLVTRCTTLEQEYNVKVTDRDHIITEQQKTIVQLKKSWIEKFRDFLNNGLWFLIIILALVTLINIAIKKFL